MLDDAELLRRYAEEGSETSFTELVRRHVDLVYGAASRRIGGDAHRAADISQTVFTALARNAGKLTQHAAISGWLYATTRNAALDAMRREKRRVRWEQDPRVNDEIISPASETVDWSRVGPVLDRALDELSERERQALLHRFFEDESYGEIGCRLGATEDAVRMQVGRALDKLQAALARRGVTSSSSALALGLKAKVTTAAPIGLSASLATAAMADAAMVTGTVGLWAGWLNLLGAKMMVAGFSTLALISVGSAVYQGRLVRQETEKVTLLEQQRTFARNRLENSERRLARIQHEVDQLEVLVASHSAPVARLAPRNAPSVQRSVEEREAAGRAFLQAHPEIKAKLIQDARSTISNNFYPFYRQAGLTRDQIEQFENLLINGRGMNVDWPAVGLGQMSWDPGEWLSPELVDGKVRALLGEGGYQMYRQAQNSSRELGLVTKLAAGLNATDEPLSVQQSDRLILALTSNRPAPKSGESANIEVSEEKLAEILSAKQIVEWNALALQAHFKASLWRASPIRTRSIP